MVNSSFMHLHDHTEYPMLDGMARIDLLADEVVCQGVSAVSVTDHDDMFGLNAFYQQMKSKGIEPTIGIEAYMAPESRSDRKRIQRDEPHQCRDDVSDRGSYLHQTVLVTNAQDLRNLFYLSSVTSYEGQISKYPRIDAELVAGHVEGIIATTGRPPDDVQTRPRLGQFNEAL